MASRHSVVITGGAGGLGLETATQFAADGYRVAICDIVAPVEPERLSPAIAFYQADMADAGAIEAAMRHIRDDVGPIHALVNNVGIAGPSGYAEDIGLDAWRHTMAVNLDAAFLCCKLVLPGMKRAGAGAILNISTMSVQTALIGRAAYVVSKAGLEALTKVIAREAGPHGIRANVVRPGAMDNDRLKQVIARVAEREGRSIDEIEREFLEYISMRSKVSMADVAGMVRYLASDAARHITGQVIAVDAGVEWER